ncbi:MAG: META domain-containing protein [Chiayiivirga sp.]|nr:META domain-containing protein [Chiayiivirga sp.]
MAHARRVTLGFGEGRAFGYAGCSRYFSGYTLSGNRLAPGPSGSTMMYCEGEGGEVERAFLPLPEHPFILQREGEHMRLIAPDGTRLEFEAAAVESRYP